MPPPTLSAPSSIQVAGSRPHFSDITTDIDSMFRRLKDRFHVHHKSSQGTTHGPAPAVLNRHLSLPHSPTEACDKNAKKTHIKKKRTDRVKITQGAPSKSSDKRELVRIPTLHDDRAYVAQPLSLHSSMNDLNAIRTDLRINGFLSKTHGILQPIRTLGTGSFGRVYLVRCRDGTNVVPRDSMPLGNLMALKRYKKKSLCDNKQHIQIQRESEILMSVNHPFIVRLYESFMNCRYVCMLMEYVPCGEFFSYTQKVRVVKERHACFYASQIVLVFEYLHSLGIVYRDLKPENLLIDTCGYVKMTDFGFAKKIEHRTYTVCGTPEYLAPEVLTKVGHNCAVDWWTLGILIYEMITGKPPFKCRQGDITEIYQTILKGKVTYPDSVFNAPARRMVSSLLSIDPRHRLGSGRTGTRDVKMHTWFDGIDWDLLYTRQYNAPFLPDLEGVSEGRHFDRFSEETDEGVDVFDNELFNSFPFVEQVF